MAGTPADHEAWLVALGQLTHMAAVAEMFLMNVLRLVGDFDQDTAKALFFTADAQPTRAKMIRRLRDLKCNAAQVQIIDKMLAGAERITTKRNEIAHSFLAFDKPADNQPLRRMNLRQTHQPLKPVTEEYLISLLDPSKTDMLALIEDYAALCDSLGAQRELLN